MALDRHKREQIATCLSPRHCNGRGGWHYGGPHHAPQQALADAEANTKAAADALAAAVTKQEEDQEVLQNLLFAKDIDGKRPRDW